MKNLALVAVLIRFNGDTW